MVNSSNLLQVPAHESNDTDVLSDYEQARLLRTQDNKKKVQKIARTRTKNLI